MIKGALFDIDDTLYSHDNHMVPKGTLRALDKLREKGIKIGVCTSRVAAEMANIPKELWDRIDCKIVGTGATTIVEGEYIKSYTIDPEDAKKYTDYFHEHKISYHYTDINGDVYYWGDLSVVNEGQMLRYALGNVKFKEYEDELVTNLFYYRAKDEECEEIARINPEALISRWGNSGNICTPLVDKSFGLLKFCQVYSFTTDEVVAAGDGINDDVMLEMAGIGIAVSDALENTKAKADYICKKSIEDGGLYDAFVDLGIIEEDDLKMKMFVFDNDGTLFDHDCGGIHEKTFLALDQLKEKGYKLVLNTSRSLEEMKNIPQRLIDMMDAIILVNGAYIIQDKKVHITYLDDETVKKLIPFFEENDITYRYTTDDGRSYLNKDNDYKYFFKDLYDMIPEIKPYEGERVLQFLYYATGDLREQIISLAGNCECSRLITAGEIAPAGKNKGLSTLEVAERYGFRREEVIAFGDSGNDIEMMEKAGYSVAVGNGTRECRAAADYVTDDIKDEGVYNALKHFGFIEG